MYIFIYFDLISTLIKNTMRISKIKYNLTDIIIIYYK